MEKTLIELVVVLSILVFTATLGIGGYQSGFPPGVISAARKEITGCCFRPKAVDHTRQQFNTDCKLGKTYIEKFLCYVGVVEEDNYDSGNWSAAHSGVYLSEGVFFVSQIVDTVSNKIRDFAKFDIDSRIKWVRFSVGQVLCDDGLANSARTGR